MNRRRSGTSGPPDALGTESQRFFDAFTPWALGLGVACVAAGWMLGGADFALGVALGALLGFANVWLLGRSIETLLRRSGTSVPSPDQPPEPADSPDILDWSPDGPNPSNAQEFSQIDAQSHRRQGVLRLVASSLAMVLILWYMPARPEGIALGVGASLLAAVLAALQAQNAGKPSA